MLHIHRHVTGLAAFRPVVVAEKLKGTWEGPVPIVAGRSRLRECGRILERLTGRPWQMGPAEARGVARAWEGCAVGHIFFGSVAVHALRVARMWRGPLVVSFHGSDVAGGFASPGYSRARARLFARADLVACRSEHLARAVLALGCPHQKLRILRTALPPVPAGEPPEPPPDGGWRILLAGRLVPKKGVATALRAFAEFARKFPLARLTIAGDGPLRARLEDEARGLGIADKVEFAGFLTQPAMQEALRLCQIYLHPSETVSGDVEGVPNAVIEALWAARACVSTRHGGIPEIVKDGVTGLLCDEGDAAGLADALGRLAADPGLLRSLAVGGRDDVRRLFPPGAPDALYREAAGINPGAGPGVRV